ncbi:MAG: hypothetical protein BroJett011_12230 [Chloroflexota bacterium]|nr:MAG: hypothetical protein BroJett011_12230 [Chloroflexota bacterium]
MKGSIADFIQVKRIDSFQKLRLLLFLYQRPEVTKSLQQLAERLYLGHLPLLERMINDLRLVGLVERVESRYQLADDPQVRSYLKVLAEMFDDPLARQQILAQVQNSNLPFDNYQSRGDWDGEMITNPLVMEVFS